MLNLKVFLLSCSLLLFLPLCSCRDTITNVTSIFDHSGESDTLVSKGGRFTLGFFTPNGSFDLRRRYIGIWYSGSDPKTVVWVANRDAPLLYRTGFFGFAGDGNLVVSAKGKGFNHSWRTNVKSSLGPGTMIAQLLDSGNLVLRDVSREGQIKWQSFTQPTDTFLPGMLLGSLNLTSWKTSNDPGVGKYMFQQDQESEGQYVINHQQSQYWKSGIYGKYISSSDLPQEITPLLSPTNQTQDYNTRLRITFDGFIQYFNETSPWIPIWLEPKDQCGLSNPCGEFGSCNSDNIVLCKCLPGFEPRYQSSWETGDYSRGCINKSPHIGKDFLNLTMMKAGKRGINGVDANNNDECMARCIQSDQCQAFSYIEYKFAQRGNVGRCWTWLEELEDIQESTEDGANLFVRVSLPYIGTNRSCGTCGTNIIPYPLSVGANCGDYNYFFFHCNASTGQLFFDSRNSSFRVTNIKREMLSFSVHVERSTDCTTIHSMRTALQLNDSWPFFVIRCNTGSNIFSVGPSLENYKQLKEIEIGWNPPMVEPTCSSSKDCRDWPKTTCNATNGGTKRCLCPLNFRLNTTFYNCTQVLADNLGPDGNSEVSQHEKKPLYLISLVAIPIMILAAGFLYNRWRKQPRTQVKRESNSGDPAFRMYDSERRVKEWISSTQFGEDDKKGIDVPFFDLGVILEATDSFSDENKLGRGGFGPVYKGKFPGGQEIAVKRLLSGSGQGLEEFKNEVMLIAKLQHRNLVRLLGYCVEGEEKILMYEYMPNKSLDSFIFDQTRSVLLTWEMRLEIILGIARGMLYLHQDSRLRIIHRDLKTSNVLLDEEMNPKISDFGLARIFEGKQTEATTQRVIGTYGYMSPEYALDGFFSIKSDVFSFGVVVLEIISGKRNTGFYPPEGQLNLISHVSYLSMMQMFGTLILFSVRIEIIYAQTWRLWTENNALNLMDRILEETCSRGEVLKCINVALLCLQEDPNDRPTMSNVLFMLGGEITKLPTPKQPAFALKPSFSSTGSSSTRPDSSFIVSASMEQGR
ncbi:G-type lectin S-receptor-like serine/threonine-protein kinase At4g03230 isoform X1 [Punica granatum]|uniref:non-specific serine/threonine protein kinase n=3 Tax=Punica granatum TaxID=22663 RepID=A0A6P8DAE5_PUNGR|nr:G-type lectin S-receptor-like serine/threonine-protein kinase At4g03230 isoform X1 [Punica granatum]